MPLTNPAAATTESMLVDADQIYETNRIALQELTRNRASRKQAADKLAARKLAEKLAAAASQRRGQAKPRPEAIEGDGNESDILPRRSVSSGSEAVLRLELDTARQQLQSRTNECEDLKLQLEAALASAAAREAERAQAEDEIRELKHQLTQERVQMRSTCEAIKAAMLEPIHPMNP
eukprot:TRINITY_DN50215_c0_g1_i2.p1 TRINITY_DN50215_c0_g1~~TRINITY_DN50215_c0_g1_i2.p1  ORF type:complete len:177 (+),score=56.32 TRINITY_DN50215_c0_g1_i2:170-700(+)